MTAATERTTTVRCTLSVLFFFLVSCSTSKSTMPSNTSGASDFEKLTDDVLYGSLALSPVSATQTGYHQHNGIALDELLDDYSPAAMDNQRKFYEGLQSRANSLNSSSLDKEQQADLEVIKNNLNLSLLE